MQPTKTVFSGRTAKISVVNLMSDGKPAPETSIFRNSNDDGLYPNNNISSVNLVRFVTVASRCITVGKSREMRKPE